MRHALPLLFALFAVITLSSCAPVKPWQREYLSRDHMALEQDPLEARSKQHMYASKEGSSGGYGVGGGGCGCN